MVQSLWAVGVVTALSEVGVSEYEVSGGDRDRGQGLVGEYVVRRVSGAAVRTRVGFRRADAAAAALGFAMTAAHF